MTDEKALLDSRDWGASAALERVNAALRQSENRLRFALDNVPNTFVIYDSQLRFQYINAHGAKVAGRRQEEILGHTNEELFPEEATREYLPHLQIALTSGKPQTTEVDVHLPDGRRCTLW